MNGQQALFAAPPRHPAQYSLELIPYLAEAVRGADSVLDPMAGVGGIARVAALAGVPLVVGVEIEPDWAHAHPCVMAGDATALPFIDSAFDAVCTSPTYGNRMSDHHDARDNSTRHTYRHAIGRPLHERNTGRYPWGDTYRRLHAEAWAEAVRVLRPGGRFVLNVKDYIENGEVVDAARLWHVATLEHLGLRLDRDLEVCCPGQRHGANSKARVNVEHIITFTYLPDWNDDELELRAEVLAGRTIVVDRRKNGPHYRLWTWAEANDLATYVGRADPYGRWPGSPWANPHRGAPNDVLVDLYRQHLEHGSGHTSTENRGDPIPPSDPYRLEHRVPAVRLLGRCTAPGRVFQ